MVDPWLCALHSLPARISGTEPPAHKLVELACLAVLCCNGCCMGIDSSSSAQHTQLAFFSRSPGLGIHRTGPHAVRIRQSSESCGSLLGQSEAGMD